jgi:phosphoglycolate phosphatase
MFRRSHGDHHASDDEGGSLPLLIFDLDGTLVETAPDLHAAMTQTLLSAGRPTGLTLRDMEPMIGDGVAKLVERAFASQVGVSKADKGQLKEAVDFFSRYYNLHCCDQSHLYPRVKDTLERLEGEGYTMAVCTNKPQRPAKAILDKLGLASHFKTVVGGDSLPISKPNPGVIFHTMAVSGLEEGTDTAIMIGDGHNDVKVAKAAGIPVIALSYGYTSIPLHQLHPDLILGSFSGIPDALVDLTDKSMC